MTIPWLGSFLFCCRHTFKPIIWGYCRCGCICNISAMKLTCVFVFFSPLTPMWFKMNIHLLFCCEICAVAVFPPWVCLGFCPGVMSCVLKPVDLVIWKLAPLQMVISPVVSQETIPENLSFVSSQEPGTLGWCYKLASFNTVLVHFQWWLLLNCCHASFFLQLILFFSLPLQRSVWKMEFDNIKSSAALIYDEFFQNAGEFSCWLKFWDACLSFDIDVVPPVCIFWQTLGQRTGSLCLLRSHKRSSSGYTFTL